MLEPLCPPVPRALQQSCDPAGALTGRLFSRLISELEDKAVQAGRQIRGTD